MSVDFRTESASKRPKTVQISTLIFQPSENPLSCGRRHRRAKTAPPRIRTISRALRCNLYQSRYNSPMRIAHDDDIGAHE